MRLRDVLTVASTGLSALGAGLLVYGALVESKAVTVERLDLRLKGWPERLDGYKIAVLADLHIRDKYSVEVASRAVQLALDESPDFVVLPGDIIAQWKPESAWMIQEVLEPLLIMEGNVIFSPGNHEYWLGNPEIMRIILDELNIRTLKNENWHHEGVTWIGIDSLNLGHPDLAAAFEGVEDGPRIVLWHEPDSVELTPLGSVLQISGHSHGGQFVFPGGFVPKTTRNGRKYRDGFYPDAPTPLFVSRGVGTTGPPSRFNCPPTVSILSLSGQEVMPLPDREILS